MPETLSVGVVGLLTSFLSNVGDGIASESERTKVQEAILALLRAGISCKADVRDAVLAAVLKCLQSTDAADGNRLVNTVMAAVAEPSTATGASGAAQHHDPVLILLSYLDLLGSIFASENNSSVGTPVTVKAHSAVVSRSSSKMSLSASTPTASTSATAVTTTASAHERRKQRQQLRDEVTMFMLGSALSAKLSEASTGKGKSSTTEGTRTIKVSLASSEASSQPQPETTAPTSAAAPTSKIPLMMPDGFTEFVYAAFALQRLREREHCQLLGATALTKPSLVAVHKENMEVENIMQVELFRTATAYLRALRLQERSGGDEAGALVNGTSGARRSRGGRNIWRPNEPLAPGDLVDAQDKEKCWFESIILDIAADGSVKVHFMGWGSKWDDVFTAAELSSRLAPLNTKTKNWRADLFTGGLIEIKCNDDPVNQKWMWGKITALNVEEAWVEVSYLFSNEPTVVKRAWLWGETICPVGMHTKDKSKAAAATLVKPLKKVTLHHDHMIAACFACFDC
jgi:hypothetical protein